MSYIKFTCFNRDYSEWELYNPNNFDKLDKSLFHINPIKNKLFNQDIFEANDKNEYVKIIHSSAREMKMIPGVICFDKIYGKIDNKKYYYKVIPDDKRLPFFLTTYKKEKNNFNKKPIKKYIVFKFLNWDNEFPKCQIIQTIGNIDNLPNF
jgi:hypothetical protein